MRVAKARTRDAACPEPRAQHVDKRCNSLSALSVLRHRDQILRDSIGALDLHSIEPRRFDAEFGVDAFWRQVQPFAEETENGFDVALGAADADLDHAVAAIDAEKMQRRAPNARAAPFELGHQVAAQNPRSFEYCVDSEKRLDETPQRIKRRRRTARTHRFRCTAQSLIEPQHRMLARACGEGVARGVVKLVDGFEAEATEQRR
jgi:hypothetical protein